MNLNQCVPLFAKVIVITFSSSQPIKRSLRRASIISRTNKVTAVIYFLPTSINSLCSIIQSKNLQNCSDWRRTWSRGNTSNVTRNFQALTLTLTSRIPLQVDR